MDRYKIPAKQSRQEILVKNSRFIATIAPTFNLDQARAFIQKIQNEFNDASHNVPAYIIGHGTTQTAHCNDDGEPAGTAGRPILAVLQGSDLGDAAIVVSRYFGGTKLGRGGLVRAYRDAARAALEVVPLAEKIATYTTKFSIPYAIYERVKRIIQAYQGRIVDQDFAAEVTISCQFSTESFDAFQKALGDLTHGKILAEIIEKNNETILPVGSLRP
jgi:uncharacterized YigZ family protein